MPFRIVVYKMQRIKAHKVRKMPVRFRQILRFIEHYDAAVVYRYIVEFFEYSLVFFRIFAKRFRIAFQRSEKVNNQSQIEIRVRFEI